LGTLNFDRIGCSPMLFFAVFYQVGRFLEEVANL